MIIGNIPAGNILTSAAILYTGSLPAKALRIFTFLNCPTISTPTFFCHQSSYLQPAINVVWLRHQSMLPSKFKKARSSYRSVEREEKTVQGTVQNVALTHL